MAGFLINVDEGETPESVARKRAMLASASPNYGHANNVGEGFAQLLMGISAGAKNRSYDKSETAGRTQGNAAYDKIIGAMSGAKKFPAAPSADGASYKTDASLGGKIVETAQSLGISPVDLGTAISYETGGTFDPKKKGPTTQWGQHEGLIQFGEPQAKKYGVDWADPVNSQLGSDGAVANYLRDAGVKPGMGMMDIYSAINAGKVGRYGASDANNGGAPGTVADKVNSQMSGHRRNAEKLLAALTGNGSQSYAPSQPQSSGMAAITAAMGGPAKNSLAPPQAPKMAQAAPAQSMPPMPQNEATSLDRIIGANVPLGPEQSQSIDLPTLMQTASNPYLSDSQKSMMQMLLKQEMQKQDPAYQMQQQADQIGLQKSQLELQNLQHPDQVPLTKYQQAQLDKASGAGAGEYGLQPIVTQDKDGTYHLFQASKDGSKPKEMELPYGWTPQQQYLDTGTGFQAAPKVGVAPQGQIIPKDVAGEALAKETGKAQGSALASLPAAQITADQTIAKIDELLKDPNLNKVSGYQSYMPDWMLAATQGGGSLGVRRRVEQLKGSAFLEAYNGLRGGGQITEVEGAKAENAMGRLETAQSDEDYVQALKDFKDAVRVGYQKLAANAGKTAQPSPQSSPAPNLKSKYGLE